VKLRILRRGAAVVKRRVCKASWREIVGRFLPDLLLQRRKAIRTSSPCGKTPILMFPSWRKPRRSTRSCI